MNKAAVSRKSTPRLKLAVAAITAACLAAAGVTLFKTFWSDGTTEASEEKVADGESTIAAKAAIQARNPDASVTYDKVFEHWTGDIVAVCGRVDIVEEQDSFEGLERFVYANGQLTLEEADGSDAVAQKWSDLCA
jgi:peroxiredoxin family protein